MYLFFDTETTGLPKNWDAPLTDFENWPRLVQLAYLLFDENGNKIGDGNFIVKPDKFEIPMESILIHGITNEKAEKLGKPISEVLTLFDDVIEKSTYIVAHNMNFDEKVLGTEFLRSGLKNSLLLKNKICTMISTTDFCAIKNKRGYKHPKLAELYHTLFKTHFTNAHDAFVDVSMTSKCFWELKKIGFAF